MLTLGATLAAAQTAQARHPILEILSSTGAAAIPFDGQFLSTSPVDEQHSAALAHSSGRLIEAFAVGPDGSSHYFVRYGYTDPSRTFWTFVDLDLGASHIAGEVAVCERPDTSVGMVYVETFGATTYVKYRAVTETGLDLAPAIGGTIFSQASTAFLTGPFMIRRADDTYLMVYGLYDVGTSHYHLYKRTSSNFTTWSAASEISIAGPADANKKSNPSLIQLPSGDIWLWFDYVESTGPNGEELTNIYYSISADNGGSWSAAVAATSYTTYGEVGLHPVAAQKTPTTMHLLFDKLMGALHMDETTTGWLTGDNVSSITFDAANGKIYVTSVANWVAKNLQNVVKIDLASWTIDKCWDATTTPAFNSSLCSSLLAWPYTQKGDGHLIPVGTCLDNAASFVQLLDGEADTIVTYAFLDHAPSLVVKNVDFTPGAGWMKAVQVDAAANRLYVFFVATGTLATNVTVGYIDLTAPPPAPGSYYAFTKLLDNYSLGLDASYGGGFSFFDYSCAVFPSEDMIAVSVGAAAYLGATAMFTLSTGGLYRKYTSAAYASYPRHGLRRVAYKNGILYGAFAYEAGYGEQDKRGLCIIDTTTDVFTFDRPPGAHDEYGLYAMCWGETGKLLISSYLYGVYSYDCAGHLWTPDNNATIPGMTPDGHDGASVIAYDPVDKFIMAGVSDSLYWAGLVVFSIYGYMRQAQYILGTLGGGGWTWAAVANLVVGYMDFEAAPVVDADGNLYAFWTNRLGAELSIKWDKDEASIDLTPYFLRPSDVSWKEALVAGAPNELSFEVANGHLFDVTNAASLLRGTLEKGRNLTLRAGDKVSGVDYWTAQGTFYVSETEMSGYERGKYPTLRVRAVDERALWAEMHIVASPYYDGDYPEDIIEDLLTRYGGKVSADINLPTFDSRHLCYHQWLDTSLKDAVEEICRHFGYAIRIAIDGTITAKKVSTASAVDLTYADQSKLYRLPVKDAYSSFVNQVLVKGEERDYIEVLYAEERVAQFNASHRWNTGSKEYTIWYSEDRSRTVRNPRLVVLDSVTSLMFALAGGCDESLTDPSRLNADSSLWDKYCVINVDSPDLTWLLAACLAALAVECLIFDSVAPAIPVQVDPETGTGATIAPGFTIPWGRVIETATLIIALNILAATGNFSYEVWGQPVGLVRRQTQSRTDAAEANDYELQRKLGRVIQTSITDALCYSAFECDRVAAYEMMVTRAQRSPIRVDKVVDLRLEAGDTIAHPHPFSGDLMTLFVTDLARTYSLPDGPGDAGAAVTDTIEGWLV
jgi:hypothetical protein